MQLALFTKICTHLHLITLQTFSTFGATPVL